MENEVENKVEKTEEVKADSLDENKEAKPKKLKAKPPIVILSIAGAILV